LWKLNTSLFLRKLQILVFGLAGLWISAVASVLGGTGVKVSFSSGSPLCGGAPRWRPPSNLLEI
jgi:hypothetical protein